MCAQHDEQKSHQAEVERMSLHNKTKSNTTRTLHSKCGGYMGGRLLFLPGEVSWTWENRV